MTTLSATQGEIVFRPRDLDIICGSGKLVFNHPGNKRFRGIINKYHSEYLPASTKREKMTVTTKVFDEVMSSGATRFLKKDPIFDKYSVANNRVGRDKVSHCLRGISVSKSRRNEKPRVKQPLSKKPSVRQHSYPKTHTLKLEQHHLKEHVVGNEWKGQIPTSPSVHYSDCRIDRLKLPQNHPISRYQEPAFMPYPSGCMSSSYMKSSATMRALFPAMVLSAHPNRFPTVGTSHKQLHSQDVAWSDESVPVTTPDSVCQVFDAVDRTTCQDQIMSDLEQLCSQPLFCDE